MNMFIKRFLRILVILLLYTPAFACSNEDVVFADKLEEQGKVVISTSQKQIPVLALKADNELLQIKLQAESIFKYSVKKVEIDLNRTTDITDIETIKLIYLGSDPKAQSGLLFAVISSPSQSVVFSGNLEIKSKEAYFRLIVTVKNKPDLLHRINASCKSVETDFEIIKNVEENKPIGLRMGIALRQHGDDQADTYRIPGLTTSKIGALLAIYDVRRESARDLQGNIDIGISRSTDGGTSWEPMKIALDRGEWGELPQKFNGISDACILVNEQNNDIFIAGLWMYGVLDKNGKWIEGLNENSSNWEHQWKGYGSQPGLDVKQTCQFLVTKSTDDGRTWSEPINLTQMCKKEEWWLWAPAPGHGITLNDGTLVFPTQGRDESGESFSNITWSKDGGTSWHTSNPASKGTTENMVVQLGDGSIMLNARDGKNKGNTSSTNGRVINTSIDFGENWTVHSTSRGALIESGCMASLHKHVYTENGEKKSILLFSNPSSKTGRNHMTIKVSFDDGASWPEKNWITLDEGSGRGYSCLTSIDERAIGILYEGSQANMVFQKIALYELLKP